MGVKWQQGVLFIPKLHQLMYFRGLICAGPTDTAAALDL
jgi:hypothetical protein